MSETQELTFAKRLKEQTTTVHDSVDNLVMSVEPFTNKENYIKFLKLQSVFHKAVDHVLVMERMSGIPISQTHDMRLTINIFTATLKLSKN